MTKHHLRGFTLLELMIAVVIVGILAAIAYPSYTSYITQARRSDATINLLRLAALQEKFMTQCGIYAANFGAAQNCTAPGTLQASNTTADGFYSLEIAVNATGSTYTLTARPQGVQSTNDLAKCTTFTINNVGLKTATGTDGNLTNGGRCWKK